MKPLCPKCKDSERMEINQKTLRYTCAGCKTTWSRNYLSGWNDGRDSVIDPGTLPDDQRNSHHETTCESIGRDGLGGITDFAIDNATGCGNAIRDERH